VVASLDDVARLSYAENVDGRKSGAALAVARMTADMARNAHLLLPAEEESLDACASTDDVLRWSLNFKQRLFSVVSQLESIRTSSRWL
jgi:hypothetical protein